MMDSVSPAPPISTPPVTPSPETKSKTWVLILGGVVLLGVGIVVGVLLGKQLYSTPQPQLVPTSSPSVTSVQEGNPTANWKTYTDERGFSYRYPSEWSSPFDLCITPQPSSESLDLLPNCIKTVIFTQNELPQFSNTGDDFLVSTDKIKVSDFDAKREVRAIGVTTLNGIVSDPNEGVNNYQVWIYKDGKPFMLWLTFIGNGTAKNTADSIVKTLDQILSTFKFSDTYLVPTPNNNSVPKTLNYLFPPGWQKTTDASASIEIGYDPNLVEKCYQDEAGIGLCVKTSYGTGSFIGIKIVPYSGGSRHQLIYQQIGEIPQKQDLLDGYWETEYSWNGKSCLFLNGISISQFPTVWGVCVIDNKRALLFTIHSRDENVYEQYLQTVRLLN